MRIIPNSRHLGVDHLSYDVGLHHEFMLSTKTVVCCTPERGSGASPAILYQDVMVSGQSTELTVLSVRRCLCLRPVRVSGILCECLSSSMKETDAPGTA